MNVSTEVQEIKTYESQLMKRLMKVRTYSVHETSLGLWWAQQLDDDKADIATSKTSPKDENPKIWEVRGTLQPYQHDI